MKISAKQYAISLFEILKDKEEKEQKEVIKNFSNVLIGNNQVSKLEEIIGFFNKFWDDYYNIKEAEIISAKKIDADLLKTIKEFISNETNSKDVKIKESRDASLLGGVILRYGDQSLDLSLKNKLNNFKKQLMN